MQIRRCPKLNRRRKAPLENMNLPTDSTRVREFTFCAGQPTPKHPRPMSKDEVFFLAKMMLDEIMELTSTVEEPDGAKSILKGYIDESKNIPKGSYESEMAQSAEQADALVDAYYYSLNAACKNGINLSKIFLLVHEANMRKRNPLTGAFKKREDGKILKPPGWKSPDIEAEITKHTVEGSWN